MQIGAQLYTVREHLKNTEDIARSLEKIAKIGYRNVQISGMADCDPKWLRAELDKNGLRAVLTHVKGEYLEQKLERVLEAHDVLGCNYIGIGTIPGYLLTEESLAAFIQNYTPIIERIRASGKRFFYHNHHFEFVHDAQGKTYMERLTEQYTPAQLAFTLDTYWVQYSGADVAAWIDRLAPRLSCIHLKDLAIVPCEGEMPKQQMAVLGEGNINFDRIFDAAKRAGTEYLLVEQDDCYGEDSFACLQRSYQYLAARNLT